MKTTVLAGATALSMLALLASCGNGNKSCNGDKACSQNCDTDKVEMYSGILPAADTDGVRYTLKLEYDKDDNFKKGDYELVEQYLAADSTAVGGYRDVKIFHSEGDFTVNTDQGKTVYRLIQDLKDSQAGSNAGPIYFVADNDSTLTMVNADLQPAGNPEMNYTLKLSK